MSLLNSIDRDHVLTAMETWDAAGGANYMLVRGGVSTHVLLHHGKEYDAAAIAGIAHGLATGRTLTPADIPGGSAGATKALRRLGFEIRDDSPPERVAGTRATRSSAPSSSSGSSRTRTTSTRSTGTSRPRVAASDRPVNLCPRCFIALPATGICDQCD
ncbi:hypothetical protein HN031_13170 [Nocardioides sp. zg-1308]|uniref:ScoMcrA-like N-terminal head domain-containing protein n=1 Tax=Nocardioides renjunii TaxID=3095075 RepID=A0ABU5KE10_9ACTN|nr:MULTISPECIES: hypothetical protein [unclassified Nocardioides]MDZ5662695.1 hypothetical protein [Nocardioides sp. S-58]NPD05638.1 hypothetical protein [Nocardioides sp. zg-1308]WQQ23516.1 hypothetical protein SHK17_05905 [Nocardioides sp. S-34]